MPPTHSIESVRRLGDFEILRQIGRGGMGVVYEARQVSLNRRVALKVLSSGLGLTDKAVQRFRREAEAAAKLHHTNIVPVYASGEQDGSYFYAMELIDGPSLDQVIAQMRQESAPAAETPIPSDSGESKQGEAVREGQTPAEPLPVGPVCRTGPQGTEVPLGKRGLQQAALAETGPYVEGSTAMGSTPGVSFSSLGSGSGYFDTLARMMAEVADALEYAHQQGIVHRDIKPSNLLLSSAGRLSVNDFGLARMLEEPGMTMTGEFVGTAAYMSPEQITAGRVPLDHRTDIYSLGATLYELLTLRRPFPGPGRDQVLTQILHKEPKAARKINPKVPVDLETICLKALEKDPDRRYQTAGQMAEDLRRYVNRFAIKARRVGPMERLWKWAKRQPKLAAAAAGLLLCAVIAAGLAYRVHLAEQTRSAEKHHHEEELLGERQRSAMDKAILLARQDDFEGARQAIREAEEQGCSPGQIHMLLGQVLLYQGKNDEAIDHLRQAVELLPDSVAAWSMLAVGYYDTGRSTERSQALEKAMQLPAVTPEDFLFRGHAESSVDPEHALQDLDEAVRRRPSVLAHLVRISVLRRNLLDTPDLEKAQLAMEEARWMKQMLPDNAMVSSETALIYLVCYHVFGDFDEAEQQRTALKQGLKEAGVLQRYSNLSNALAARWQFLQGVGREKDAVADLRDRATNDPVAGYYYPIALYLGGDCNKAVEILQKSRPHHFLRVIALADSGQGIEKANQLYQEIAARDPRDWDLFNSQLMLRFLGRKPEAIEVSRKFLNQPDRFPPLGQEVFRRQLEYCAGQRSEEDLINSMKGHRGDLCGSYLCVALTALADGDRDKAKTNLQRCFATHEFEYLPYDISLMLLSRMKKDRTWPPWIPVGKNEKVTP